MPARSIGFHQSQNAAETLISRPAKTPPVLHGLGLQGYYLRALKMMNVPKEMAEEHYVDLSSKPFYKGLVEYIVRWRQDHALR